MPALAPPLIEQPTVVPHDEVGGVRFVDGHPGELPRLVDDSADATLFVPPEDLISAARLPAGVGRHPVAR